MKKGKQISAHSWIPVRAGRVRIPSVRVTVTSVSNLSSSTRAFTRGFTEYKSVPQVMKHPDSLRHSAAVVVVGMCGEQCQGGFRWPGSVPYSVSLCFIQCPHGKGMK